MQMYPHWNARDNYRFGLKKKKRKREKGDDPGELPRTSPTHAESSLAFQWHALGREEQAKYYDMARLERQTHMRLYPGWTARDNYAKHKKKARKRDPGGVGSAGHREGGRDAGGGGGGGNGGGSARTTRVL